MKDIPDSTKTDVLCADSARVASEYEVLDMQDTKTAFEELDNFLYGLADELIQTLDQIIPHLAEMQSLLSQRGKARKAVLKKAGLPSWPEYGQAYAAKLDCSFRTIQDHITGLRRNGKSGPSLPKGTKRQPKRLKLTAREQVAIVESQRDAANESIPAVDYRDDLQTVEFDGLAVTPEPDWKSVLVELLDVLEQHGDRLPLPILNKKRAIETMLSAGVNAPVVAVSNIEIPRRKAPMSVGLECSGCEVLHRGIANKAEAHPEWSDQQLAEQSGCSLTIVRQAKTRHLYRREAA